MKNKYSFILALFTILFLNQFSHAQSALSESENGTVIQAYLNQKSNELNLQSVDLQDLYVTKEFYSKSSGITHVYVNQRYQGIPIHNAISSVNIKDNLVFYFANRLINQLDQKINTTTPITSTAQAIQNTASHFNLGTLQNLELLSSNGNAFIFSNAGVSQNQIPVKLVYTQTEEGMLRLSWDLSIKTTDGKNWWSARVDAVTGTVIDSNNWILTCNLTDDNHGSHNHSDALATANNSDSNFSLEKTTSFLTADGSSYNVFALPAESPNHGGRQLLSEPSDDLASPFGWHDTDGATGPEFTITRGNNVWAQEDRNGNNGVGFSPEGTASLTFDFPLNQDQPAAGYEDVSVTNLFYMNNMMHDIWYKYGFDEASGNFQSNNYGNGGLGNDFVRADAQDGSGTNNATFGTPPDGSNPVMSMFLWSPAGPPGEPFTINNGPLAGGYVAIPAGFGDPLPITPITADMAVFIDDDAGASTDPQDACDAVTNGANLAGKIVVIRRGECEFGFKVLAAENEGAVAVVVVNNVATDPIQMGAGVDGASVTIPSVMVSQADGNALITELLSGATVNGSLFETGPYPLDGDFDNGIIAHEYGHGISNRLTGGGNNTGCLGNQEQMGEGWSDWFGLMVTMKATDLPGDIRGIGTFATGQPTDGQGIRPAPYSTDFAINGFTYGDSNNTATVSVPHGVGFVWSTMLWDLTWAYIEKYGFDPDLYNGVGGNNKVMQLVLDGLKLQACNPGFIDGRDALLAADTATGGEDQCMIWEVFANRGLGLNADQGSTNSRTDQVEDFTLPPDTDPTLQNCTSLSVSEVVLGDYKIYPNPTNNILTIKTIKNFGEVTLTLTDINGREILNKKVNLFGKVNLDISNVRTGIYILNIKGDTLNKSEKIIKN